MSKLRIISSFFFILVLSLILVSCNFDYRWSIRIVEPVNNTIIYGNKPIVPRVVGKLDIKFSKDKDEKKSKDVSILPVEGNVFCNGIKGIISKNSKTWVVENVPLHRFDKENLVCSYNEPSYSTLDKRTVTYVQFEDGNLVGNKNELFPGESLYLTIKDQVIPAETIQALYGTLVVKLKKLNENTLVLVVPGLENPEIQSLKFTINSKNYSFDFRVKQLPVIDTQTQIQVVDDFKNNLIASVESNLSNLNTAEKNYILPKFEQFKTILNELNEGELLLISTYLSIQFNLNNKHRFDDYFVSELKGKTSCLGGPSLYWKNGPITFQILVNLGGLESTKFDLAGMTVDAIKAIYDIYKKKVPTKDLLKVLDIFSDIAGPLLAHDRFMNLREELKEDFDCALVPYGKVFISNANNCSQGGDLEILNYLSFEKAIDRYRICSRNVYEADVLSNREKISSLAIAIRRLENFFKGSLFESVGYDAPISLPTTFSPQIMDAELDNLTITGFTNGIKDPLIEQNTANQSLFVTYKQWVKSATNFTYDVDYIISGVGGPSSKFKGILTSNLTLSIAFLPGAPFRGVRVRPDCNAKEGLTYAWDWGDGSQTDGFLVTHQYAPPQGDKTYTIKVIAKNDKDEQIGNAATTTIFIPGGDKEINISFTRTGMDELCAGDPIPTPTPDPTPGD